MAKMKDKKETQLFKISLPAPMLHATVFKSKIYVLHIKGLLVVSLEAILQSINAERCAPRLLSCCRCIVVSALCRCTV